MSLRRSILFFSPSYGITQQTRPSHLLPFTRGISTRQSLETGEFLWSVYLTYLNKECLPVLEKIDKNFYENALSISKMFVRLTQNYNYNNRWLLDRADSEDYLSMATSNWSHSKRGFKNKIGAIKDEKLVQLVNQCIEMIDLGFEQIDFHAYDFEKPKSNYFRLMYDSKREMPHFYLPNTPKISFDRDELKSPSLTLSKKTNRKELLCHLRENLRKN